MSKEYEKKKKELAEKSEHKMHKTSHSTEYCRHCGEKVSSSTRHESGHREYDHENDTNTINGKNSASIRLPR